MHKAEAKTVKKEALFPDKLFYKIGEVSKIADIETYVLRYWETEFPFLRPRKNKSGQRVYTKKDLEQILRIKELLYKERYTIEGVRKRFSENLTTSKTVSEAEKPKPLAQSQSLEFVKQRLRALLEQLK